MKTGLWDLNGKTSKNERETKFQNFEFAGHKELSEPKLKLSRMVGIFRAHF
jgi:hypothetical protein